MSAPLPIDEVLRKASPEPNTGCWLWTGGDNGRGYGRLKFQNRAQQAHRVFYELLRGPISPGMELDHLCRVTFCVNPDHLEPVKHKENVKRGFAGEVMRSRFAKQTHCKRGHPFQGHNLMVRRNGQRQCRACHYIRRAKNNDSA